MIIKIEFITFDYCSIEFKRKWKEWKRDSKIIKIDILFF